MTNSSMVSPSITCVDCGKILGCTHDLKEMVMAPIPTTKNCNNVEILKKALNTWVDMPSIPCKDCCKMLRSLHDGKKMAMALILDSCIIVDILVKAWNIIVKGDQLSRTCLNKYIGQL